MFSRFCGRDRCSSLGLVKKVFCGQNLRAFSASSQPKLGWVGTGVMGSHMCSHLINAGYPMTVYSRTRSKCEPLEKIGATIVDSPVEVAQQSDIIFTMVGYPNDVRETIVGDNGLIKGCKADNIIVDMTTSQPSLAVEMNDETTALGVHCLDAPVSGGDIGAKNGTLSIMCGGEQSIFDKVLPMFEIMGNNIKLMGPIGAGQHTKMVNQILIATNMIGVCEGLIYAHKIGLDLKEVIAAVGTGGAGSFSVNVLGNRIIKGDLEPGFFVEHFVKDMSIALDEAKRMNLSLPGLALAHQLYIALMAQGYKRRGTQALVLALESLSGESSFKELEMSRMAREKTDEW